MQIRHSYSIGSIVPISSSTTFTTTEKTKTAANARISYRPGLHFLTRKYNLVSPTVLWKNSAFEGFQHNVLSCAHSRWTAAFARCTCGVPFVHPGETFIFCFTHFCNDRNHSSLILTVSPTSNTLTAVKIQPTCLYWSITRVDYRLQAICSVPGKFPGHGDVLLLEVLQQLVHLLVLYKREVSLWLGSTECTL